MEHLSPLFVNHFSSYNNTFLVIIITLYQCTLSPIIIGALLSILHWFTSHHLHNYVDAHLIILIIMLMHIITTYRFFITLFSMVHIITQISKTIFLLWELVSLFLSHNHFFSFFDALLVNLRLCWCTYHQLLPFLYFLCTSHPPPIHKAF